MQKSTLLADYVDLRAQLAHDQAVDRQTLKQRDRHIGLEHPDDSDQQLLRRWIAALRADHVSTEQAADRRRGSGYPGRDLQRFVGHVMMVLWPLGLVAGAVLARAVLDYDGRQPVNLFSTLLVLIGLQLMALMLLVSLTVTGGRGILQMLSVFNPAAMVMKLLRRLTSNDPPSPVMATVADLLDGRSDTTAKRSGLSLLIYLAQHFSVAFNVGIVATLLYLVTISDLAFGWNTTLNIDSGAVLEGFRSLSWPWQSFLPAAVPDAELVEQSRYYRLEGQLRSTDWRVDQFGVWWLYILAALLLYGFLPRLVALVAYGIHYDRTLARSLVATPGASQVVARMRSPLVTTDSKSGSGDDPNTVSRPLPRTRQPGRELSAVLVCWSGIDEQEIAVPGISMIDRHEAGGHQSLEQDRQLAAAIGGRKSDGVVIAVKAWEPPTLEINDFITTLRKQIGKESMVLVLLVPISGQQVSNAQLETWETGLSNLADSALYAEPLK